MPQRLRAAWDRWSANRRQYRIERATYKAGGGRDVRHGGATGGAAGETRGTKLDRIADTGRHSGDGD